MLKNKFQIFMRLIFFFENINQCATSVKEIGTLTFLVKRLELYKTACSFFHSPVFCLKLYLMKKLITNLD